MVRFKQKIGVGLMKMNFRRHFSGYKNLRQHLVERQETEISNRTKGIIILI